MENCGMQLFLISFQKQNAIYLITDWNKRDVAYDNVSHSLIDIRLISYLVCFFLFKNNPDLH